jgi:hypothetical protein
MHVPLNVKSPNNISKWQMGFNSAFKRLSPSHQLQCKRQQESNTCSGPQKLTQATELYVVKQSYIQEMNIVTKMLGDKN